MIDYDSFFLGSGFLGANKARSALIELEDVVRYGRAIAALSSSIALACKIGPPPTLVSAILSMTANTQ